MDRKYTPVWPSERIYNALRDFGPMMVDEIAVMLQLRKEQCHRTLWNLRAAGKVAYSKVSLQWVCTDRSGYTRYATRASRKGLPFPKLGERWPPMAKDA